MKFCLALIAVLGLCGLARGAATDVDCSKVDQAFEDLGPVEGWSFISKEHIPPSTVDQYKNRCKESEAAITNLRIYNTKCNTALTKQVVSAMLESRKESIQSMCEDDAKAQTGVAAINCLREKAFEPVKAAELRAILSPQVLNEQKNMPDKERLMRACCGVLANKQAFLDATKPCEEHKKIYEGYIDSYLRTSMTLICPDTDKLIKEGQCNQYTPLPHEGVEPKSTHFLAPVVKTVRTLDHKAQA